MESFSQTYDERIEEDHIFVVFFLNDDDDQSVRVEEVEEINLYEVILHLDLGGSIFITHGRKPNRDLSSRKQGSRRGSKISRSLGTSPAYK